MSAKRLKPQPSLAKQQNSSKEVERGSALKRWPQPEGNKGPLHIFMHYKYPGGSACSFVLLKRSSICKQSQEFSELQVQPWDSKISGLMAIFFPRLYLWLQNSGDSGERTIYLCGSNSTEWPHSQACPWQTDGSQLTRGKQALRQ